MEINIGKFHFLNKMDNKISHYRDFYNVLDYFYLEEKEDTLFVNSRYVFDLLGENNIYKNGEYYKFEKDLLKRYYILDYNMLIKNSINRYIEEKAFKKFINEDYSRYELYNNIELQQIINYDDNSKFAFNYDSNEILDVEKTKIIKDDFIFDPYTEKIENIDEIFVQGKLNNKINKVILRMEIENGKAPDFVYEVLKINEFLKNKKTINVILEDGKKINLKSAIYSILEKRNNTFHLGWNLSNEIRFRSNECELDKISKITYMKKEIGFNSDTFKNIKEQIILSPFDKFYFKCDELNEEIREKYNNYIDKIKRNYMQEHDNYLSCPFYIQNAFNVIQEIKDGKEFPEWYSEELDKLFDEYVNIKSLESIKSKGEIRNIANSLNDPELNEIVKSLEEIDGEIEM